MTKKHLITSALLYINGYPHMGHMAGCLLPADIYARFLRQTGKDVLFVGGTDEHGAPTEVAAEKAGLDPQPYCDKWFETHKDLYQKFNLSFDFLGRTSSEQNKEMTYRIFEGLEKNGYITEKTTQQAYSVDDDKFLPDSYVTGTCPFCGHEKAKGDQCENCTKVLDPIDLINPRSVLSGSTNLEFRKTKNLFLELPKLAGDLDKWIETKKGLWPDIAYSTAKKWLREGLQDRSITRDLKWGFPVPRPGYEDKVFYVWFDAPIGYIGITKQWSDANPTQRNWQDWWLDPDNVTHTEFMAKDNIPFHTVFFPASLRGSGEKWTEVSMLKGASFLNFSGGKFSKSENRGIFLDDALVEFPADYWRYWVITNYPETNDADFTFDSFAATINKDLNDVLGNFINRVLKMTQSNFGDVIPPIGRTTENEQELYQNLNALIKTYIEQMEHLEFRKSLATLREIWVSGNNYIAKTEPWKVVKEDTDYAGTILYTGFNLIRLFATLSAPIMPETSEKMLNILNADANVLWTNETMEKYLTHLTGGQKFNPCEPLFQKITPEQRDALKIKYKEVE